MTAQNAPTVFGHLFLSAGAMKAGTTWLYSVLEQHPELHFTPEKELHYFYHRYVDDRQLSDPARLRLAKERYLERFDPERANPDRVRANLHWVAAYLSRPVDDLWYRGLFTRPRGELYACDFSNLYAHLPKEAWPRIRAGCSRLRVIYTMRHPVKRLWSHVKFHLQVTGQLEKLDQWSPEELNRFMRRDFLWPNAEYGAALRRMRAGLPEECFLPLFYEDMRSEPLAVLRRIESFLGLDPASYPEALINRQVNASASIPMPDFFPALVAKDVARIIAEVRAEGLEVPESWTR
ncbi:Sulfotransferase family protein [Pseudooceanicola antarcticus]|uniref:Sulfotransferase n=1 Tax=Pseudooceanicola antarcticus TaxID=1247613 RepID=A0A285HYI5_9RHOB|nr:sulfotransferase [Pseudooceanicola antarcticus]PJE30362.1 sulfotransferase [Pseudooceanicola antarcticus]SNY40769.1 Sulfotransferase family protein [Pseudooceanicola antarcticus]